MRAIAAIEWVHYDSNDLALGARDVHFWTIPDRRIPISDLTAEEQRRAKNMSNDEARWNYQSAQGGLRAIVSLYTHVPANQVILHRGFRGKPYVSGGLEFNLTHSSGCIIAAFSKCAVGLDLECAVRRVRADSLAHKFFHSEEADDVLSAHSANKNLLFLCYWICKEAITKLSGEGIYRGLRHARVDLARERGSFRGRDVWLWIFRPGSNLIAALASWEPLEAKGFFRL